MNCGELTLVHFCVSMPQCPDIWLNIRLNGGFLNMVSIGGFWLKQIVLHCVTELQAVCPRLMLPRVMQAHHRQPTPGLLQPPQPS